MVDPAKGEWDMWLGGEKGNIRRTENIFFNFSPLIAGAKTKRICGGGII